MRPAAAAPCSACPWRTANQGKPHPLGFYTKANLRRLWAGLRTARAPGMTCHPTDPRQEEPGKAKDHLDFDEQTQECAGALLLVKRELVAFQADPYGYAHRARLGLTKDGLRYWALGRCGPLAGTPIGPPSMRDVPETPEVSRP